MDPFVGFLLRLGTIAGLSRLPSGSISLQGWGRQVIINFEFSYLNLYRSSWLAVEGLISNSETSCSKISYHSLNLYFSEIKVYGVNPNLDKSRVEHF
jgi:hypothetical protein